MKRKPMIYVASAAFSILVAGSLYYFARHYCIFRMSAFFIGVISCFAFYQIKNLLES